MGYEQSYISALEIGTRGPPTDEFVAKLVDVLKLDEEEQTALRRAVQESARRYILPNNAPTEVFRMYAELWEGQEQLHPAQIQMIREVIRLKDSIANTVRPGPGRVIRRQEREAEM